MSEFVPELLRRMQSAIRKRSRLANGRTPISILPLQESFASEHLPWEPGWIELAPDEHQLLARLWWELNQELGPEEVISESDVLHFALEQIQCGLRGANREEMLLRLEEPSAVTAVTSKSTIRKLSHSHGSAGPE